MSETFAGKVAVVTGGAKGIGEATAQAFAREGARVSILDIDSSEFPTDVSDENQVRDAFQRIGQADILINNAGIQHYGTVTTTSRDEWDRVLSVNLTGAFLCAKYALPLMLARGGGVIINVASVQAFQSQPNVAAYTTAKTALLGLTRSIAVDYAPHIRCLAVCPGAVDTPMLREAAKQHPASPEVKRQSTDAHLINRLATPLEIADLILYLASDKASFMTGHAIRIDGGLGISLPGVRAEKL